MTTLFSSYENFWSTKQPNKLLVKATDIAKLGQIRRKTVEDELATNSAGRNLGEAFERQLRKGRRTYTLVKRTWEKDV